LLNSHGCFFFHFFNHMYRASWWWRTSQPSNDTGVLSILLNAGSFNSKELSSWNFLHQDAESQIYQCHWLWHGLYLDSLQCDGNFNTYFFDFSTHCSEAEECICRKYGTHLLNWYYMQSWNIFLGVPPCSLWFSLCLLC
jgi:hypothetical protein